MKEIILLFTIISCINAEFHAISNRNIDSSNIVGIYIESTLTNCFLRCQKNQNCREVGFNASLSTELICYLLKGDMTVGKMNIVNVNAVKENGIHGDGKDNGGNDNGDVNGSGDNDNDSENGDNDNDVASSTQTPTIPTGSSSTQVPTIATASSSTQAPTIQTASSSTQASTIPTASSSTEALTIPPVVTTQGVSTPKASSSTQASTTPTASSRTQAPTIPPVRCNGQDDGCCTRETPCRMDEGDCDHDDHCAGSLICGKRNCPWGVHDDCCELDVMSGTVIGHADKGNWTKFVTCPPEKKITGFRLQVHEERVDHDNTALNGIQFSCQGGTYTRKIENDWGNWTEWKICDDNGYVTKMNVRGDNNNNGDDYGATNVQIQCSGGEKKIGDGVANGSWHVFKSCRSNTYICGIRAKFERPQGSGDDSTLNRIRLGCCPDS